MIRFGLMKRLSIFLILFSVLFWGARCSSERPEIQIADLKHYVETLSADGYKGRESGTAYAHAAAGFIVQRYQRADLFPAFPNPNKRSAGLFLQEFQFPGGIEIREGSYLRAAPGTTGFQNPKNVIPLPLGYAGKATGDLVFMGFCIDAPGWNDFAGLDVKDLEDRIAVCLRHGPGGDKDSRFRQAISFRAKYATLAKRKFAGVVFLGRDGFPAPSPSDLDGVSSRAMPAVFVEATEIFQSFDFLKAAEKQMRETAKKSPGAAGGIGRVLARVEMSTRFREQKLTGYNVGAYLRPPRSGERVIVVGAHFDHIGNGSFSSLRGKGEIHNGADDNASGTAAVLELALHLKSLEDETSAAADNDGAADLETKTALTRIPVGVNVLFLHFDAEERGLFGSRHFMESKAVPAKHIAAMINLDMVGRLRPDKGLSVQGEQTADARWGTIIRKAFADSGFAEDIELRMVKGGGGPSDHSAFYSEKVPVAFLFTGGHREYHTSEDDAHLVNFEGLEKITGMTGRLVTGLAALEHAALPSDAATEANLIMDRKKMGTPLAYRRAPAEAVRTDFEFRVRLGIMPGDYSRDAGGLPVADVRDNAPVKRTGLRAGDVIVKLGEREIRDINDYMEFLGDASAQKEYVIVFKRDDQEIRGRTRLIAAP